MFFFGHVGIGSKLAFPFARKLPRRALLFGTIFPDVLDKPLYYGLSWIEDLRGHYNHDLDVVCGTRTFGHTGLLLLCVVATAFFRKSKTLAAFGIGIATHLILDNTGDSFGHGLHGYEAKALLWPLQGWQFPVNPYYSLGEHVASFSRPYIYGGEIAGVLILLWDYWKEKYILRKSKAVQLTGARNS